MIGRLFHWTTVFLIIHCIQESYGQKTCTSGNPKTIQINNVQSWDQVLQNEEIKSLIDKLEADENVKSINFRFNVVNSPAVEEPPGSTPATAYTNANTPLPSSTTTTLEETTQSAGDGTAAVPTTPLSSTVQEFEFTHGTDTNAYTPPPSSTIAAWEALTTSMDDSTVAVPTTQLPTSSNREDTITSAGTIIGKPTTGPVDGSYTVPHTQLSNSPNDATTITVPPSPTKAIREESTASRTHSTKPQPTTTNAQDTPCEEEWYHAGDGHCYKLFKNKRNFQYAFEDCRKQLNNAATLAIGIRNLAIRSEIISALDLASNGNPREIWIGLKQPKSGGNWFWTDNTSMTSAQGAEGWRSDEPSNHFNEDCAALDRNHDFTFGDFDCTKTTYYICEFAQSYDMRVIDNWWKFANT